jgi:tetratricopeptide (TPR) repeat protein
MFKYFEKNTIDLIDRFEQGLREERKEFFDSEEYLDMIRFYESIYDDEALGEVLELAVEQYPNDTDILLRQACFYLFVRMDNKAMEIIRYVEDLEPSLAEIYFLKAVIHNRRKQFKESDEMLALAKENGVEEIDILIGKAGQLIEKEEKEEKDRAYSILADRIDDMLKDDDYFEQILRIASETGHLKDFETALEDRSVNDPFNKNIKRRLVEFYTETGMFAQASDVNSFILAIDPDDVEAKWFSNQVVEISTDILSRISENENIGEVSRNEYYSILYAAEYCEKEGQLAFARDYYLKLLEVPFKREVTFMRLGRIACMNDLYSNARIYLEKSLFTIRENGVKDRELEAEVYHWLSRVYEEFNDIERMLEYDLLAIEKDLGNKDNLYFYILDLCDCKQFSVAEKYLDEADLGSEMQGAVFLMLGAIKFFQKKYDEAANLFYQAFVTDESTTEDAEFYLDDIKNNMPLEDVLSEFYRMQITGK